MPDCHVAIVIRCDSMVDFGACPYYGYSTTGEPFGAYPCYGYSAPAGSPFSAYPCRAFRLGRAA